MKKQEEQEEEKERLFTCHSHFQLMGMGLLIDM